MLKGTWSRHRQIHLQTNPVPITPGQLTNAVAAAVGATTVAGGAGTEIPSSQVLAAMASVLAALLVDQVTPENVDARKEEVEKCRE